MSSGSVAVVVLACSAGLAEQAPDHTGVRWALPFPEAQKRAKSEQRLLLVKPIAFGTEKSGGW